MNTGRWLQKLAENAPIDMGGHWRALAAGEQGHGQQGEPQVGKTWVDRKNLMRLGGKKPFDHQADFSEAVDDLKPGGGIIAAHGKGCLSGKSRVKINRAGKTFTIRMEDLYAKFNHFAGAWQADIETTAQCHIGGRVRLNHIVAVYETGLKPLF